MDVDPIHGIYLYLAFSIIKTLQLVISYPLNSLYSQFSILLAHATRGFLSTRRITGSTSGDPIHGWGLPTGRVQHIKLEGKKKHRILFPDQSKCTMQQNLQLR